MARPSFTVYVDNVGTSHTFIKLDDGNGKVDYFGFAPATAGSPHGRGQVGEGVATHLKGDPQNKAAGYIDDAGWSKTIAVTTAQHDAMINAVSVWRGANHTYNGLATLGGENCATFVQAVAKAGGITEIVTSRVSLPINLVPASERQSLFITDADGRRSASDALRDPLNTPGTPAHEFKKSNPELFKAGANEKPTPDSMNSQLHQNKDGSFTEVIKRLDGDSWTNEYTADGVAVSTTQTDGAKNDADYASRTTAYDSQGLEDWHSIARDDGTKWRVDFDQKNERGDKKMESASDAQARVDWERVTQDTGAVHATEYDQNNEHGYRVWETVKNPQGQVELQRVTQDSGAVHATAYDQNNEHGYRVWETVKNAQGQVELQRVTQDSGAVHATAYDQKNEHGYRIWETALDAQGRVDWERVTQDSGTVHLTDHDQAAERADRLLSTLTDAQGRRDWDRSVMDNGTTEVRDYDERNERADQIWVTLVDAQGRVTGEEVFQDSGRHDNTYYDSDGTRSWVRFERHFDAQNREDSSTVHNDDGSRIETNYDQEDSQPWTSVVKTITPDGVELTDVNYDPGYVEHTGPPPLTPFPYTDATYMSFPSGGGSACVSALGETSCGPRYDVEYGWF